MKMIAAVVLTNLLVSFSALSAPSKILLARAGIKNKSIPIFDTINKEQSDLLFIF